jgi:tRNA modification GTPase
MDFAAGELDDVDIVSPQQIATSIAEVQSPLELLAATYSRGHRLREGASLALVGRPNVGKSSLFNCLLQRERAIVTPVPGTTRDTVEETAAIGGIPVRLIDTAGLRLSGDAPLDQAEEMGIARSREALADADLVLLVFDCAQPVSDEEQALLQSLQDRPHLAIRNKIDLLATAASAGSPSPSEPELPTATLLTSARTGEGIDALRAAILHGLQATGSVAAEGVLNTLRQRQAVDEAIASLIAAALANQNGLAHELLLVDLHQALRSLDSLTGATTTDDILNRIFSTFCIGK